MTTADNKFICEICNYSTNLKCNYDRHIISDKHKIKISCTQPAEKEPKEHICELCNYKTPDKSNLNRHFLSVQHKNKVAGIEPAVKEPKEHICELCNYKTPDKSNLNHHYLSMQHKNKVAGIEPTKKEPTEYKCELCNYSTFNPSNYKKHELSTKHRKKASGNEDEPENVNMAEIRKKRDKLFLEKCKLSGIIDRAKGIYLKAPKRITAQELAEYKETWDEAEEQRKKVVAKLMKYDEIWRNRPRTESNKSNDSEQINDDELESDTQPNEQPNEQPDEPDESNTSYNNDYFYDDLSKIDIDEQFRADLRAKSARIREIMKSFGISTESTESDEINAGQDNEQDNEHDDDNEQNDDDDDEPNNDWKDDPKELQEGLKDYFRILVNEARTKNC